MHKIKLELEDKILLALNSLGAISISNSKDLNDIKNLLNENLNSEAILNKLFELKEKGYVENINNKFYLTDKGILRLMSKFS